jgi:ABC-2 type transport system permease protein
VAGDLLAGEATAGTYRLLITRPISRFRLITAKFISAVIYTNVLVFWLAIVSLGLGIIIFGVGELIVIKSSSIIIFPKYDIFWRFILGYGFASLSMMVVASLAFLLSSFVENAIGPIVTTMAIIIAFIIISAIDIEIFQKIKPFLFTNYMNSWRLLFDDPVDISRIIQSVLILAGHIAVFFGAAVYVFHKKDILT